MVKINHSEKSLTEIKRYLNQNRGERVRVQVVNNGVFDLDKFYQVPVNSFGNFWDTVYFDFLIESEKTILDLSLNLQPTIILTKEREVPNKFVLQRFLDSGGHCLLDPIQSWCDEKIETTEGSNLKKYNALNNKLKKYKTIFKNGVPQDRIQEVCDKLNVNIKINNIITDHAFIECRSSKNNILKNFSFVNTRLNHVDYFLNKEHTFSTQKKIISLKKKLDKTKEFYLYKPGNSYLSCLSGVYVVENELTKIFQKFEKESGMENCKICDFKQPELSKFVRAGLIYNRSQEFIKLEEYDELEGDFREHDGINHIDMKKAYTKFKDCIMYEGFLGKITDFRKCSGMKVEDLYIGMYEIEMEYIPEFFIKFNYKSGVFPLPELKWMLNEGFKFQIIQGCWGTKLDFEYPDYMLQRSNKGTRLYSIHSGNSVCDNHSTSYLMKGDDNFVSCLKNNGFESVSIYEDDTYFTQGEGLYDANNKKKPDEIRVEIKKDFNSHLSHIYSFILSYMRISVMEQLKLIKPENVIRIVVDGIYHKQENLELKKNFIDDKEMNFNNICGETYLNPERSQVVAEGDYKCFNSIECHFGPGGSGKTFQNLTDKGTVKLLYVVTSHKLRSSKAKEFGCNSDVLTNLLIDGSEILINGQLVKTKNKCAEVLKNYNTIIFDECSMICEDTKSKLIKKYKGTKMIFCGDVGYQIDPIVGETFKFTDYKIYYHTENYRVKCDKFKYYLGLLREKINCEQNEMIEYIKSMFTNISTEQLKEKYKKEDTILVGTNPLVKYYTELFSHIEKYKVIKNIPTSGVMYYNGDITFHKVNQSVLQHGFTAHSIQGETLENNIFIDVSRLWNNKILYTAISRAREMDQIYIINDNLSKRKFGKNLKIEESRFIEEN